MLTNLRDIAVVTVGALTLAIWTAGIVALVLLPGELAQLVKSYP